MRLREIKQSITSLSLLQVIKLDAWIHGLIEGNEHVDNQRNTASKRPANHKTYRSEMVRCGKKRCKCVEGKLHGPYWYAYWTEGGPGVPSTPPTCLLPSPR